MNKWERVYSSSYFPAHQGTDPSIPGGTRRYQERPEHSGRGLSTMYLWRPPPPGGGECCLKSSRAHRPSTQWSQETIQHLGFLVSLLKEWNRKINSDFHSLWLWGLTKQDWQKVLLKFNFQGWEGRHGIGGNRLWCSGPQVTPVRKVPQSQGRDQDGCVQGHQTSRQRKEAGSQGMAREGRTLFWVVPKQCLPWWEETRGPGSV